MYRLTNLPDKLILRSSSRRQDHSRQQDGVFPFFGQWSPRSLGLKCGRGRRRDSTLGSWPWDYTASMARDQEIEAIFTTADDQMQGLWGLHRCLKAATDSAAPEALIPYRKRHLMAVWTN